MRTTEYGYSDYDALNLSVEKRYSNNYSIRCAYSIGHSRGVTAGQEDTPQLQVGTDLKLDEYEATAGTDRRHNFTLSGRMEIPKADRRDPERNASRDERNAVHDSGHTTDADQNRHQVRALAGGHV